MCNFSLQHQHGVPAAEAPLAIINYGAAWVVVPCTLFLVGIKFNRSLYLTE